MFWILLRLTMPDHEDLQAVAVFVVIGLSCFFGFLATPWFPSPLNWNLASGSVILTLVVGIVYFKWRRISKKGMRGFKQGVGVIIKNETGSRVLTYEPHEPKTAVRLAQAFVQGLLKGLHRSSQASPTKASRAIIVSLCPNCHAAIQDTSAAICPSCGHKLSGAFLHSV